MSIIAARAPDPAPEPATTPPPEEPTPSTTPDLITLANFTTAAYDLTTASNLTTASDFMTSFETTENPDQNDLLKQLEELQATARQLEVQASALDKQIISTEDIIEMLQSLKDYLESGRRHRLRRSSSAEIVSFLSYRRLFGPTLS